MKFSFTYLKSIRSSIFRNLLQRILMHGLSKSRPRRMMFVFRKTWKHFIIAFGADINPWKKKTKSKNFFYIQIKSISLQAIKGNLNRFLLFGEKGGDGLCEKQFYGWRVQYINFKFMKYCSYIFLKIEGFRYRQRWQKGNTWELNHPCSSFSRRFIYKKKSIERELTLANEKKAEFTKCKKNSRFSLETKNFFFRV